MKIGLTALPIIAAISGVIVFLIMSINSSNLKDNSNDDPPHHSSIAAHPTHNEKKRAVGNIGNYHPPHHISLQPPAPFNHHATISRDNLQVDEIPQIIPGLVQYIPVKVSHEPKKLPIFTPNTMTPSEIRRNFENISVFPNIQVSEIYKYIRIDYRNISLDEKIISYVVCTAVKKAQISDGAISFGYQYSNPEKSGISISLFWSDVDGNVRKIRTYNVELKRIRM